MSINIVLILILLIVPVSSIQIPFVRDVIFVPVSISNSTTMTNYTCDQCLCMPSSSYLILNCLPNDTCQFFSSFPRTYKAQQIINARLYFLQGVLPNASQCCMPNITYLLNKLYTATPVYGQVLGPRCLVLDNHGYLVTISQTNFSIVRFDSTNLTLIDNTYYSLFSASRTIKYYNGHYYVGLSTLISVIDSNNLTMINNITSSFLTETRDMMFLNNGDIFVAVSTGNNYLLFFNRSNNASTNYNFAYNQLVNYVNPHGLFYINDTYFYTTSWDFNTVYTYSGSQNSTVWTENLFLDARSVASSSDGNHITIDECGRFWFSLGDYGVIIFDSRGLFLANFTLPSSSIFDTLMIDNYVIYLSDTNSNRIIRIDPNIQCFLL